MESMISIDTNILVRFLVLQVIEPSNITLGIIEALEQFEQILRMWREL